MTEQCSNTLYKLMMELYEKEDYLGVIESTKEQDRYYLSDNQLLLLAASYYELGKKDIDYLKAGVSFLLPLEHSSINACSQWHFYMGLSFHGICNYARAFKHFHEFLALNANNTDEKSIERQQVVKQKLSSCQAFLTLPLFNHTYANRVQHFWRSFDNLASLIILYVDKLNHVKKEQTATRSRSLHSCQKKCSQAIDHIKLLLGALLPGQKFSIRFLPPNKAPAKFEIVFPIGRFISRLQALKYFVSQASIYTSNSDQFICTIGTPIYEHYDCHMGGYNLTSHEVQIFIRVDEYGQCQEVKRRQIILYSSKLASCPDVLRAQLLTRLLYHTCGELAIHTYFDDISVIDNQENDELIKHINNDTIFNQAQVDEAIENFEHHCKNHELDNNQDEAFNSKLVDNQKSLDGIDNSDNSNVEHKHYLQLPLNKLNTYLMFQGLQGGNFDFNEYWSSYNLDIFAQHLFESEPGASSELNDEDDEAIALRLEAFWTLTNCYELEDYMTDLDQSTSIACYDWGIMPCFMIIPLSNLNLPHDCYLSNYTIKQEHLDSVKQIVLTYKDDLVKRLYSHCKSNSFYCTGLALSHEFLFIDLLLWQPFCVLDGLHEIIINDGFEGVGLKSFHPFTNEMAIDELTYTLSHAQPKQ